jgi:hypothetical protein
MQFVTLSESTDTTMIRIWEVLLFLLYGLLAQDSHAQRRVTHLSEIEQPWQPSFQMGLNTEAAAWGENVIISRFLSRNANYNSGDHGCFLKISLFYFRVNSLGAVDSVYSNGSLNNNLVATIKANILATEGKWKIPKNTQPTDKCWFIYPVIDPGRSKSCPDQQMISRNALVELLALYSRAESTIDNHGRIMLPPNEFPQYSEN